MRKSNFYNIFVILTFIFLFLVSFKCSVYAASNYNGATIGNNVEINKVWKITFNKELDESSVNSSTIVVKDSGGNIVQTNLTVENNRCIVDIAPVGNYQYGQAYDVTVKSGVKTATGNILEKDVNLKFYTKKDDSSNKDNLNNKYTVTIDASHGGDDSGGISDSGIKEKDINLSVALKTGEILKKNGVNVVYTRTGDTQKDTQSRVDIANKANSNEFVSIHTNAYSYNKDVKGIETYYSTSAQSKDIAESIQKQLISSTGSIDRGIKEGQSNQDLLNESKIPSAMVYLGFMTNQSESSLMATSDFQDKSAKAIANGILASLKLIIRDPAENQNKPQTPNKSSNSNKPVIVLDPGHGVGDDVGSSGNGYQEDDVTLSVALKIGEILEKNGVNVIYTRSKDERNTSSLTVIQSLQRRCDTANNSGAKYMVSIHTNAVTSNAAEGTETLYYLGNSEGQRLALLIQQNLVNAIGTYNRGLKDGRWLYITKNTKMTTVLTELGFLTNSKDASILGTDAGRQKAAQGVANGILKALGML
ncbi:N-acetylmuramoyl-L-alanine amidase [Clostridium sp. LBM24168]